MVIRKWKLCSLYFDILTFTFIGFRVCFMLLHIIRLSKEFSNTSTHFSLYRYFYTYILLSIYIL